MTQQQTTLYKGVRQNPAHGAWELDPKPARDELNQFYLSKYYELIKDGGRAPNLRRLMEGGASADRERNWLRHTQFSDFEALLSAHADGRRVLDIGCGTGDFISYLNEHGYQAKGLEISKDAAGLAKERGLDVECTDFDSFARAARDKGEKYDAVTLLNVLEHVPDAVAQIEGVVPLLKPGGVLAVTVPNDFNDLQKAAAAAHDLEPWWIARPDHINYFSHDTLAKLYEQCGFDVVDRTTGFPMEFFLLMGKIYPGNPEVGSECHAMRQAFEFALPTEQRRRFYKALADLGWGREAIVVGKLRG